MRKLFVVASFLLIMFFAVCGDGRVYSQQHKASNQVIQTETLQVLNSDKISLLCEYLNSLLWINRDAYDAAHVLLVPLEYAFLKNNTILKQCFANYVSRLRVAVESQQIDVGRLVWLQHLHFVARYWVLLSQEQNIEYIIVHPDFFWLISEFERFWLQDPAWLWGRDPFPGIRARIEWKLSTTDEAIPRSYYNVIIDEDYYALALGLDLYGLFRRAGRLSECTFYKEAKDLFMRIFKERITWFEGDRWLIDVGRWRDHPDNSFSTYYNAPLSLEGNLLPKETRPDVVVDSSHAHRYPSWLRSADLAVTGADKIYITLLRKGLRKQFLKVILAPEQGKVPMLNNYMDGHIGLFRWGYSTHQGVHKGYGPYMLSGTFTLGWWSLLGGGGIAQQYKRLADAYPLSAAERSLYQGSSTREQHSLVTGGYENGLRLIIAQMAVEIANKAKPDRE